MADFSVRVEDNGNIWLPINTESEIKFTEYILNHLHVVSDPGPEGEPPYVALTPSEDGDPVDAIAWVTLNYGFDRAVDFAEDIAACYNNYGRMLLAARAVVAANVTITEQMDIKEIASIIARQQETIDALRLAIGWIPEGDGLICT